MIKETDGSESNEWFAPVLILLDLRSCKDVEETEVSFVKYMEVIPPWDQLDDTLRCISMRWLNSKGKDFTGIKDGSTEDVVQVGAWYGVEPVKCFDGHHIPYKIKSVFKWVTPIY